VSAGVPPEHSAPPGGAAPASRATPRAGQPRRVWALAVFLAALALSHAVQFWRERTQPPPASDGRSVALLRAPGSAPGSERVTLAYIDEGPGSPGRSTAASAGAAAEADARNDRPVVVLLHGSPGAGSDFARLTPLLTARGYRVIAPDMPGFGRSDPWPARDGAPPMFALARDDYSIRAHADAVLALLEHLGVRRAHLVGWSMGGGVALHAADLDSAAANETGTGGRIASVTLLASVGTQANEGSGVREIERVKYALTLLPIAYGPEALPHFGLLGPHSFRRAAFRNFWDTDLRALEDVCRRTRVPTLVLQGEGDVLVPWRSALHYHAVIPGARLIASDANHFLPFLQPDETASDLLAFFAAAEGRVAPAESRSAGASARAEDTGFDGAMARALATPGAVIDRAPTVERGRVSALLDRAGEAIAGPRWAWAHILVLALLAYRSRPWAAVVAGLFLAPPLHLDWGACAMGLALGALLRPLVAMIRREPADHDRADADEWRRRLRATPVSTAWRSNIAPWLERESGPGWLRAVGAGAAPAWGALAFWPVRASAAWISSALTVLVLSLFVPETLRAWELAAGWLGVVAALLFARVVAGAVPLLLARGGRQLLRAELARWTHHEWWPAWLFYLPLWWHAPRQGLKHGGLTLPGCVNPGIPNAGGWIGEPKHLIDQGLGALDPGVRAMVALALLVPADLPPERRAALARDLVRERFGDEYPVIVKPDAAQRGFSVRLVRDPAQFEAYFRATPIPAVGARRRERDARRGGALACERGAPARGAHLLDHAQDLRDGDGRRTAHHRGPGAAPPAPAEAGGRVHGASAGATQRGARAGRGGAPGQRGEPLPGHALQRRGGPHHARAARGHRTRGAVLSRAG
jgi:pimeloyl-ACP methyl ester carboxylesterase